MDVPDWNAHQWVLAVLIGVPVLIIVGLIVVTMFQTAFSNIRDIASNPVGLLMYPGIFAVVGVIAFAVGASLTLSMIIGGVVAGGWFVLALFFAT
ncbi:hypothetical protein ACPPVO_22505 [Dactylosporangium sp. McL0621]|uniref:hypothetical protein n=1 Tax=Dactylosporangium sp. McL0621 TaxID=3415678 RepID=UPI003CEAC2FC